MQMSENNKKKNNEELGADFGPLWRHFFTLFGGQIVPKYDGDKEEVVVLRMVMLMPSSPSPAPPEIDTHSARCRALCSPRGRHTWGR